MERDRTNLGNSKREKRKRAWCLTEGKKKIPMLRKCLLKVQEERMRHDAQKQRVTAARAALSNYLQDPLATPRTRKRLESVVETVRFYLINV